MRLYDQDMIKSCVVHELFMTAYITKCSCDPVASYAIIQPRVVVLLNEMSVTSSYVPDSHGYFPTFQISVN